MKTLYNENKHKECDQFFELLKLHRAFNNTQWFQISKFCGQNEDMISVEEALSKIESIGELMNFIVTHRESKEIFNQIMEYYFEFKDQSECIQFLKEKMKHPIAKKFHFHKNSKIFRKLFSWEQHEIAFEYFKSIPIRLEKEMNLLPIFLQHYSEKNDIVKVLECFEFLDEIFVGDIHKFVEILGTFYENRPNEECEEIYKKLTQKLMVIVQKNKNYEAIRLFSEFKKENFFFSPKLLTMIVDELLKLNKLEIAIKFINVGKWINSTELFFRVFNILYSSNQVECNEFFDILKLKNFSLKPIHWFQVFKMFYHKKDFIRGDEALEIYNQFNKKKKIIA
jgi:tetratricopeptide (TPR) repeat protein